MSFVAGSSWSTRRKAVVGVAVVVALAAVVLGAVLLRGDDEPAAPPATTTTRPPPIAPLTGLPSESEEAAARCAVSVKIGNTADAHPQIGVSGADVVYEQVVDGGVTRLLAVYQSQAPDQVGSVRSVRPTDRFILWPLRGVFAYSGGNAYELASLEGVPVVDLDEATAGDLMFRGPGVAPHNLFARVDGMYSRCTDPAPTPLFSYREPPASPVGSPASAVTVGFGRGYDTAWEWDAEQGRWDRTIFAAPDLDPEGDRIGTENVVVMEVAYVPDPTGNTLEAAMVGEGPVRVLTDGAVVEGTWRRPDLETAAELVGADGRTLLLTPGTTWVELLPSGNPVTVTP